MVCDCCANAALATTMAKQIARNIVRNEGAVAFIGMAVSLGFKLFIDIHL
jgi:hypothetical protein